MKLIFIIKKLFDISNSKVNFYMLIDVIFYIFISTINVDYII
jgi:hypothetical protein